MAETGVSYKLDSGTLAAVKGAGVGGETQEHLAKAAGAEALQGIVKGVEEQIVEKQVDTAAREDAWDTGFDAMGDKGSWASGELYDQFHDMEAVYKDEYLEAVRKGDTKKQKRMLKDQSTRASGLQEWKKTMETAKQINDGVGWSAAFKGPENAENREIMLALTKLDGETAVARFGDQGEMVFDIKVKGPPAKTVTRTRREIDEMVAKGVKPVKKQLEFMQSLDAYKQGAADGSIAFFNRGTIMERNKLGIKDEDISTLMYEDFGTGTFSQHIKKSPEMIAQFADVMGDGDGTISTEEAANLNALIDKDMDTIIKALENNPEMAREYLAEWQTGMMENNWNEGRGVKDANDYYDKLNSFKKGSLEQRKFIWKHESEEGLASGESYSEWLENNAMPTE